MWTPEMRIGVGAVLGTALLLGAGMTGEAFTASGADAPRPALGPAGYKTLSLGLDEDRAVATGLIREPQTIGSCHWYYLVPAEGPQNPGNGVVVSPERGVVSIPGTEAMRTPEGITMGSVDNANGSGFDEVSRAYPDLAHQPGDPDFVYETPVPSNPDAHFRFAFGEDGKVKDISLTADDDGGCGLNSATGRR